MKVKIEIKDSNGDSYNYTSWDNSGNYFDPYFKTKGWIIDAFTENINLFKPIAESGALENELQIRLSSGTYFISYYEAVVNRVSKQIKIVLP